MYAALSIAGDRETKMPVEMAWEPRGVRSRFFGVVTAADLLHHVQEIIRRPDFTDLRFSILDFRNATDAVDDADLLELKSQLVDLQVLKSGAAKLLSDRVAIVHLSEVSDAFQKTVGDPGRAAARRGHRAGSSAVDRH